MPRSFYKSSPLQSRQISNVTSHSYDRVCKHLFFLLQVNLLILLYFCRFINLEETFQSKIYVLIFPIAETLATDSRWSDTCILFILYGPQCPLGFIRYIWYDYFYCICSDILLYSLKLLHHLSFAFIWLSMPVILFSICMSHFALMATNYWYIHALVYIYVPIYSISTFF